MATSSLNGVNPAVPPTLRPKLDDELDGLCQLGHRDAVESLIQHRQAGSADYSPPLNEMLCAAAIWNGVNIASYCLENGNYSLGTGGRGVPDRLLTLIIINKSLDVYRLLLESRVVDPNFYVPWYGDILGLKAADNDMEWVKLSLDHGANPNKNRNQENRTVLALAVETGNQEMVELLLQYGAEVRGSGAIVEAGDRGHTHLVQLLLSRGADINEIGIEGPPGEEGIEDMGTSLHMAISSGFEETALFLINAGGDIEAKDPMGRTPGDLAREFNQTQVLEAMRRENEGGS